MWGVFLNARPIPSKHENKTGMAIVQHKLRIYKIQYDMSPDTWRKVTVNSGQGVVSKNVRRPAAKWEDDIVKVEG